MGGGENWWEGREYDEGKEIEGGMGGMKGKEIIREKVKRWEKRCGGSGKEGSEEGENWWEGGE